MLFHVFQSSAVLIALCGSPCATSSTTPKRIASIKGVGPANSPNSIMPGRRSACHGVMWTDWRIVSLADSPSTRRKKRQASYWMLSVEAGTAASWLLPEWMISSIRLIRHIVMTRIRPYTANPVQKKHFLRGFYRCISTGLRYKSEILCVCMFVCLFELQLAMTRQPVMGWDHHYLHKNI